MSYDAIKWAMDQPVSKSHAKFTLIALANCVNGDGPEMLCWPSVQHLADITMMDRKTVVESMKRLRECGYLEDTGQRKGATGQIPVYRLTQPEAAAPMAIVSHYVYRLTNPKTGQFYIGVRTCEGQPERDSAYRGSGRWCQVQRLSEVALDKKIMAVFPSRSDAEMAERDEIEREFMRPECMNIQVKKGVAPNRSIGKSGLLANDESNPKTSQKPPALPLKATQDSLLSHPKTGHGTSKEPVRNQEGTKRRSSSFDAGGVDLPEWLEREAWRRWVRDRKARNKPITEDAARLQLEKLAGYVRDGFAACEVIDHSIASGYQGLFPPKRASTKTASKHSGFNNVNYLEGVTNGIPDA